MIASQCLLVKHGGIAAEETPLGSFNHLTFIVLNRKTDVKDLKKWEDDFSSFFSFLPPIIPGSRCPHQHNTRMPGLHNWNCPHKDKQVFLHVLQGGCLTPPGRGLALGLGRILTLLGLCYTWLGCDDYNRGLTTEDTPGYCTHLYTTQCWYCTVLVVRLIYTMDIFPTKLLRIFTTKVWSRLS